ncbi:MAG: L-threonylcarbamoyladenylate synthase [Muribaculaceae bacterium]|nr:L-threonylcarbamoyladenylate synthase [Muribaculaceae bacterium]
MKTLRIYPSSINTRFIDEAAEALRQGAIIIYPTDTFYAMGCSALSNTAIERLCHLKGINPQKETLSIVCSDISQASEYARIDNKAYKLIRANVPGPFTFILPAATTLPKVFKGRRSVGIRIPDSSIARELAAALGNPLLSTSITLGQDSGSYEIEPEAIEIEFGHLSQIDIMINGGPGLLMGSTVVDLTDSSSPEIIREGAGTLTE